tara:strand:- start:337 stop:819 length:483 start_codon:yes stop_codon:yes gene_type:complete
MKFTQLIKLYEVTQKFGPPYTKIYNTGEKIYYKDPHFRIVHRVDGPAIEYADGSEAWYLNHELHRVGGPAITLLRTSDTPFYTMEIALHAGDKAWFQNDKLHRTDGPAVERNNGTQLWYINGNKLSPKEIKEQKQKIALDKRVETDEDNALGGVWGILNP